MAYFLGIDIGGSKSHALIADERGQAVGLGLGGPGNHEDVGYAGLTETLVQITTAALKSAGIAQTQLAGAGFGVAGYDWPGQRGLTLAALRPLALDGIPFEIVNDTLIGLLAGASQGWGVAVVAGTRCNSWGWDRQRQAGRMTGLGLRFGEAAGAVELVDKAMEVVTLAWTRRGPPTRLSEQLVEYAGAQNVADLLEGLTLGRYRLDAAAAPLVFQTATAGDSVAAELVLWAGRELGSLANGVIRQLAFEAEEFEVVLIGSFYNGSPLVTDTMGQTIHAVAPGARLVRLTAPPVVGGVLLGMEQAGLKASSLRQKLIQSTREMVGG